VVQMRYLETKKEALAKGITETYGYYEISITDFWQVIRLALLALRRRACWEDGSLQANRLRRRSEGLQVQF
jgi:hypothetical protein